MKLLALAVATILSTGYVPAVNGTARVVDADQAKVENCAFVKDVSGSSVGSRGGTRVAIGTAMEQAREDAAKAGATHIVWGKITNPNVANVTGKAYRCGS